MADDLEIEDDDEVEDGVDLELIHSDLSEISGQLSDVADLLAVLAMAQVGHTGAQGRLTAILERRRL